MTAAQKLQFKESLKHADYWLIVPVIIMSILSHLSRAVRWKILIEPMGYKPSTVNTFYSVMVGYLANTFVPRAGEILKCSLLGRYEKIPVNKLVGTIIVERAFDFICYLVFIIITILIQARLVGNFAKEKLSQLNSSDAAIPAWIKLSFIILLLIIGLITLRWIFRRYSENKVVKKIRGFSHGLKEGFNTITRLKNRGWFIGHTIFIWLMYLMQIYVGFSALDATSHLGIKEACSVLSLATLGMIVSPGGIGAFPIAVQEVLLIYDLDNVSFGWLIWGVATGLILIGGIICFILILIKNRKRNEISTTTGRENILSSGDSQAG